MFLTMLTRLVLILFSSYYSRADCDVPEINQNKVINHDLPCQNTQNNSLKDLVQTQYSQLPFPPFSEQDMETERRNYQVKDRPHIPTFVPRHLLERINHFLFKGKQDFR